MRDASPWCRPTERAAAWSKGLGELVADLIMARRFHGHQRVTGGAEAVEQLLVSLGVFGEGGRLEAHGPGLVHHRDDMLLGRHIDPDEAHARPFRRGTSGASEPVLMPTLVHARTPTAPQDTVRVLSTGRGRQSQA